MNEKVRDLWLAALDIVGDFKQWGPVLQFGIDDDYGPDSPIGRLMVAVDNLDPEKNDD